MSAAPRTGFFAPALLGLCLALAACGSNTSDLAHYVAGIKNRAPQSIEPMPRIAGYHPAVFRPAGPRSPFALPKRADPHGGNGVHPNLNRPLDPLEKFPLDSLHMVGTIASSGTTYALIAAPDQVVHRIAPGDHIGQHYGRVQSIGNKGLTLTEIVPDGNGGYVKHAAALSPPG